MQMGNFLPLALEIGRIVVEMWRNRNEKLKESTNSSDYSHFLVSELLEISCGGTLRGRYVGIWKKNSRNYLNICEIRVFGPSGETGGNNNQQNNTHNNGGGSGASTHTGGKEV